MPPVFREDPYPAYNFLVEVSGVSDDGQLVKGAFCEVSGLDVEVPPIEYRNGPEDITMRKIPGLVKYTNFTFKRGYTGDLAFWNWIVAAMKGQIVRAEGSIVMLDENRQEVMRWNFKRAWPTKATGPSFNAKNNEIAMETLEIAHEGIEIDGQA